MVKKKKTEKQDQKRLESISFTLMEVIVIVLISILFGGIIGSLVTSSKSIKKDSYLEEFYSTYDNLIQEYYKKVDKGELIDSAIEGMINYLGDPYSTFMDSEESQDFNTTVNGEYEGIGITVAMISSRPTIVSIFDSSPAAKAGMKAGDIITQINDQKITDQSLEEIIEMIKKKKKVQLVALRDEKEYSFTVSLSTVTIPSVSSEVYEKEGKKIGMLSVSVFAANTYQQFRDELEHLEKKKIDSLVIDVRDNPGGHLTQVSDVLSLFLDKKKVLYQIKTGEKKTKVYAKTNQKRSYPIAVLINQSSASAAEILAGAMKESYQATIIGVNSYGKGTVQKEYSLSSGSSIKYTTEEWLTPDGNNIHKKGIQPDMEVNLSDEYKNDPTEENDNQLQAALTFLAK